MNAFTPAGWRWLFLAMVTATSWPMVAAQVILYPVADTTLMQLAPTNNSGGSTFMNAGTAGNGFLNRALLRFDVAGNLPANATVWQTSLTVEVVRQPGGTVAASTFALSRVLQSWGEGAKVASPNSPGLGQPATVGEATWQDRQGLSGLPWSVPGGAFGTDFSSAITAEQIIYGAGDSPYVFASTPQMVGEVQGWLSSPENNFGWVLYSEAEDSRYTARSFGSREGAFAPSLAIEYTIVPEPGVGFLVIYGLLAGGCGTVIRGWWTRRR